MTDQDKRVSAFAKVAVLFYRYGVALIGAVLVCALTANTLTDRSPASYYAFFLILVVGALVLLNFLVEGAPAQVNRKFVEERSRSLREFVLRNRRGLAVSALVLLYWVVIPLLGFYVSTALLLLAGFLCLGIGGKQAVMVAGGIVIAAFLLFTYVLNIPLPEGVLV